MTLKNIDLNPERSYLILRYFRLFRLLNRAGLLFDIIFINAKRLSMDNGRDLLAQLTISLIITEPRWGLVGAKRIAP